MSSPITVATFPTNFDMKYMLFKEMLNEAGIQYMTINEVGSTIDGTYAGSPSNIGIEIRVMEDKFEEAMKIYNSIE